MLREVPALFIPPHGNLRVYRRACTLEGHVFWHTRSFPRREHYALTDQLRRATHDISRNIEKGWVKRYQAPVFRGHIEDAQGACAELGLWLHLAWDSCYLTDQDHQALQHARAEIQWMLTRLYRQRIALLAGAGTP